MSVTVERPGPTTGPGEVPSAPPVLLVVDPEPTSRAQVATTFSVEGFRVVTSAGGEDALVQAATMPALILFDPGAGGDDQVELFRRLAATAPGVPVIVLSGRDGPLDAVVALESGAADHVTKPVRARELNARVRAVLRRVVVPSSPFDEAAVAGNRNGNGAGTGEAWTVDGPGGRGVVTYGPVRLDHAQREVEIRGVPVELSRKEFDLLALLVAAGGNVVTREQCMDSIWRNRAKADSRTLDTHVKRLRKKIEFEPADPRHLLTVRGIGYRFTP
jgi:two-component system response regulator RegX3